MPNYVTDEAVCVRVTDFSETSQIASLFTRGHGILPVIAKGSKRVSKTGAGSFSGPLDLLTAGDVVFIPAKGGGEAGGGELATLTAWQLTDNRTELRKHLGALHGAMVAVEVTTALLHPHDPHEALFEELEAAMDLLAGAERMRGLVAYVKGALTEAGYQPQLTNCGGCGAAVGGEAEVQFSFRGGSVFCGRCAVQGATARLAGRLAVALDRLPGARALRAAAPERAADPVALKNALELLLTHVEMVVGKPLRTRHLAENIFK